MTSSLISFIRELPTGLLLILPILLIGLFTLVITRDQRRTWRVMAVFALMMATTTGFYFWRLYLTQHFVGRFDAFGLPTELYRSGLYILLDAWPIWVFPTALVIVIAVGWYKQQNHRSSLLKPSTVDANGIQSHDLSLRLEVQKLQRQLLIAKQKLQQTRHDLPAPSKMQQLKQDHIQRDLQDQIAQLHQQNQQSHEHIISLENDLSRAKSLIERLLNEHLDTNDSP